MGGIIWLTGVNILFSIQQYIDTCYTWYDVDALSFQMWQVSYTEFSYQDELCLVGLRKTFIIYSLRLKIGVPFGFYTVIKEMISSADFNGKIWLIYYNY